jgi:predicted TPR repeat methyltransferase
VKLPELKDDYGKLYEMTFTPIRTKLLLIGIELKVFNHLSSPTSSEAVAQAINTHPGNTRVFLDGLAAIDLVQKKKGLYQNTALAQAFLVEASQTYLGQMLTFMASANAPPENLAKLVKEGPPPQPEQSQFSEEMLTQSAVMMANIELAGDAQQVVRIVSELPEFSSFQKMLDLGAGPGLIGLSIVDAHPTMKGVVFDLPAVVKVAETFIKKYGMEDRMEVLGGDYNRDAVGEGYDLVVTCNSLQFAKEVDSVVKKIYDSLNPGGVFVSMFGFGQTHERTKPESLVLGLLPSALVGLHTGFDQGYIADSMLSVEFKSVCSRIVTSGWGQMELDIARK